MKARATIAITIAVYLTISLVTAAQAQAQNQSAHGHNRTQAWANRLPKTSLAILSTTPDRTDHSSCARDEISSVDTAMSSYCENEEAVDVTPNNDGERQYEESWAATEDKPNQSHYFVKM